MLINDDPLQTPALADLRVAALLVDDQAMVGEAVRRLLDGESGIDFHYCADSARAVEMAAEIKPTVILQDLVMPGVDGLHLLADYRATPKLRDVPVIVLSTKDDPKVKSAAFSAGANDYLVKLPDAIELAARLRYHSRSYHALQQRDAVFRALRASQQQLTEANLVLQRMSMSDGLTGLANRRHFDKYLEIEWQRAMGEGTALSLLLIDVDHFKIYNDHFGHVAGDDALRRIASCLAALSLRVTDLTARYGGEEFAIVLPSTSPGGARLFAEKVRRSIEDLNIEHVTPHPGARVSASIGVATLKPRRGDESMLLIELADRGLYQAKRNGRNQVCLATPSLPAF